MISRASSIDDLLADLIEFLLADEVPVTDKLGDEPKSGSGRQSTVLELVQGQGVNNGS